MDSKVALIIFSLIAIAICNNADEPTNSTPAPTTTMPPAQPTTPPEPTTEAPGPSPSRGPRPISSSSEPDTTQAATEIISTTVTDSSTFAQLSGVLLATLISALLR
ncbi:unnamed protein product [Cylicocyclus nassatus]|uniref:Uncharacterized protein n=1 Tax=Cylicocyclus nassatus TaxID=53992 RepID=A0AA36M8Z5_CYLNA|nr:unnamed protein product [Cylicocyclus nassatus]